MKKGPFSASADNILKNHRYKFRIVSLCPEKVVSREKMTSFSGKPLEATSEIIFFLRKQLIEKILSTTKKET